MKLTRRRRRKIYKGIGIGLLILLVIWLIIINPFQYIHINFNFAKKEEKVLKEDTKDTEDENKKAEEEAKRKAEEEAKEKAEEEKKKQEELEKQKEKTTQDNYYSVTFFNPDGTVLKTMYFKEGTIPYFGGEDPSFYDGVHYYEFIGWNKVFSPIIGNAIYVAQYKIIGDVDPTPTPDPKPKPDPKPEEPDVEVIDLTDYDLFYIENIGSKKGKVQIINGVGDYSKIENKTIKEMLSPLKAPVLHLQYSFDKKNWYDFEAYGSYDLCAEIIKKHGIPLDSVLPENVLIDSKNPIELKDGEKVYFKAKTGFDNLGFSDVVTISGSEIPCVNFFDIKGYENFDDTTFAVGGDLKFVVDDDYIANETNKTNKQKVLACNAYGFAGLFGNISNEFISIATDIYDDEIVTNTFMTNLSLAFEPVLNESSLEAKKVEINLHNGDNVVSASDLKFPNLNTTSYVCYSYMFADSNKLQNAPNIGSVKPGTYSFIGMFASCDSLSSYPYQLASSIRSVQDDQSTNAGCYQDLFAYCSNLETVKNELLPATILSKNCYYGMFKGSAITTLPTLPAETLAISCYDQMYMDCFNIPDTFNLFNYLQATTLDNCCYRDMFANSSITNLPNLPAQNMKEACYKSMFAGCQKLEEVPIDYLPALSLAPYCYQCMFEKTSIISTPDLPANNIYSCSYDHMFSGCENIINGPEIKMESFIDVDLELEASPLNNMFAGCIGLKNVTLSNLYIKEDNVNYLKDFLFGTYSKVDGEKRKLYVLTYEDDALYDEIKISTILTDAGVIDPEYWEATEIQ